MHLASLLSDRPSFVKALAFCFVVAALLGCAQPSDHAAAPATPPKDTPPSAQTDSRPAASKTVAANGGAEKLATEHLPNAYRIHPKVISGGLPEGDAGFAELESLGVKTVISVDGATPDVELAKKFGMRYVHLPHGYDGVSEARAKDLAKAVRDLEGPVYIHCHHGKHRSPAAAVVACVSAGLIPPDGATSILQTAGTSPNYRGLYQSAESARALEKELLDELEAEFPAVAPIPPMAEAMIGIEHAHDHLKAFAANDWRKLEKHPDLDPAHEALLLREHFTELMRTEAARAESTGFQKLLAEGETAAQALEDALRVWQASETKENGAQAKSALDMVNKNCANCHKTYRDVPLGEKAKR